MSRINVAPKHNSKVRERVLTTAAGTLIALSLSAGAAVAGAYDTVSSSGQELASFGVTAFDSEPFAGSVNTEAAEAVNFLPNAELEAMLAVEPAVAPADQADNFFGMEDIQETIIGLDARTRNYTTSYPARATVLIIFEGGRCTGFMIGENTVGTAGHCVHQGDGGRFFNPASFRVLPGFDGNVAPFGECGARELFTVGGWIRNADPKFDLGAIKLDCNVGAQTGWFGLRINPGQNEPATVTGYPGDKPLQQWQGTDIVRRTESRQLFYATDTVGGNSGGPVWNDWQTSEGSQGPFVIAIHAYGTGSPQGFNGGTRLTQDVVGFLVDVKNTP